MKAQLDNSFSEALLDEGNFRRYFPPPANMRFTDQTVSIQVSVPHVRRRSPSLSVESKGKKPKRESLAKIDYEEMPIPPLRQSSVAVLVQQPKSRSPKKKVVILLPSHAAPSSSSSL